jgi:hypothetical protein
LIVISVIVYVLRQNCRAAGWRWDSIINIISTVSICFEAGSGIHNRELLEA